MEHNTSVVEPLAQLSYPDRRQYIELLIVLIVFLALYVRAWGIEYGLPSLYHPDEPDYAATAQRIFKTGDLNPHVFNYPSLFYYVNAAAYIPFYAVGKLTGWFHSRDDIPAPKKLALGIGYTEMPETLLLGRYVTVLFSIGTVILVFLVGKRLSGEPLAGLLAALLTSVSSFNVVQSRLITPDTYVVFFVVLSIWACILASQEGKSWQYVLAGLAAGLAASSKYNGVIIVLAVIAAHFMRYGWKGIREWRLYLALGLSGVAFFAATPFALLDYQKFIADFQSEARHYSTGHLGMEGETLKFYLMQLIERDGLIAVLAALGVVWASFTRSKTMILLAVFPLTYFLFINQFIVRNDRTLLPLTPFVYLLGSTFLVGLSGLRDNLHPLLGKAVNLAVGVLAFISVLAPFSDMIIASNFRQSGAENRETARKWIYENLAEGSRITVEAYSTYPDTRRFMVAVLNNLSEKTAQQFVDEGFDYVVLSDFTYGRLQSQPDIFTSQLAQYNSMLSQFELVRDFPHPAYGIRIYRVTGQKKSETRLRTSTIRGISYVLLRSDGQFEFLLRRSSFSATCRSTDILLV